MAPPHSATNGKHRDKPNIARPSNTKSQSQPALASGDKKKNGKTKANKKKHHEDPGKHRTDEISKVGKDKKHRQRGGRGKGRGKGAKSPQNVTALQAAHDEAPAVVKHKAKNPGDSSDKQPAERHNLLTLPEEIRRQIISMVLQDPDTIATPLKLQAAPLFSVCRQLRDEAVWIFLSANRFHLDADCQQLHRKDRPGVQ